MLAITGNWEIGNCGIRKLENWKLGNEEIGNLEMVEMEIWKL